jgi:phosphoribosylformylglycinamidine synthase
MVYRIFVEKKEELAHEAHALYAEISGLLGISGIERVRVLNRYDVENISEELFESSIGTVFSEPQLDIVTRELCADGARVFAVEYLPGQFDQRADSAAQCIQLMSCGERPALRSAKVYALYGNLSDVEVESIKKYVINPVEAREASLDVPETLALDYEVPTQVATVEGFCSMDDEALAGMVKTLGLAMDLDDIRFCRDYFISEGRDPSITEIRMIDTYWSDH